MILPLLIVSVLLLNESECQEFNPCSIDDSICMPLEDFQENCTCILLSDKPFNSSDEIFLYFSGYPIPLKYFKQVELDPFFRDKLDVRIPRKDFYSVDEYFPEHIFKSFEIEENLALFLANSSSDIFSFLNETQLLRTAQLRQFADKWCSEGECNAFVYESTVRNRSAGVYSHAADLLQIVQFNGLSLFAVSSVEVRFNVAKVAYSHCRYKCSPFYYSENDLCIRLCEQRVAFDHISVIGEIKRKVDFFARSSAIYNFREKYANYLS